MIFTMYLFTDYNIMRQAFLTQTSIWVYSDPIQSCYLIVIFLYYQKCTKLTYSKKVCTPA